MPSNPCHATGTGPNCWHPTVVPKNQRPRVSGGGESGNTQATQPPAAVNNFSTGGAALREDGLNARNDAKLEFTTRGADVVAPTLGLTSQGGGGGSSLTGEPTGVTLSDTGSETDADAKKDRGEEAKAECIAALEEKFRQDFADCVCETLGNRERQNKFFIGAGVSAYGECMRDIDVDFTVCFCNFETCNAGNEFPNRETDPAVVPPTDETKTGKPKFSETQINSQLSDLSLSSTYDTVIPYVYNRAIVKGNIFFVGNVKTIYSSETDTIGPIGDQEIKKYYYTQNFVDIAVGICEGPVFAISKVYFGNVLIYSGVLETGQDTQVQNLAAFNRAEDIADKRRERSLQVRFYDGGEDQLPAPDTTGGVAYRGLAYVLFKNVEIPENYGEELPDITIEVIERPSLEKFSQRGVSSVAVTDYAVDKKQQVIYYKKNNGVAKFDLQTMIETDFIDTPVVDNPIDIETLRVNSEGTVTYQLENGFSSRPIYFDKGTIKYGLATDAPIEDGTVPYYQEATSFTDVSARLDVPTPHLFAVKDGRRHVIEVAQGGTVRSKLPLANRTLLTSDVIKAMYTDTITTNDSLRTQLLFTIAAPIGTLSQIKIIEEVLTQTNTQPYYTGLTAPVTSIIPNSVYGGLVDAQVVTTLHFPFAQCILIVVSNATTTAIINYNYISLSIDYVTVIPGEFLLRHVIGSNTDYVYFAQSTGEIYKLEIVIGETTLVSRETDFSITDIDYTKPQIYNSNSQTLTVISTTGQVIKLYMESTAYTNVSIAPLVERIVQAGAVESYSVAPISAINTLGYAVVTQQTLAFLLGQLGEVYNFGTHEEDAGLVFSNFAVSTSNATIATSERKKETELAYVLLDNAIDVPGVVVNYFNAGDDLQIGTQASTDNVSTDKDETFVYPVVLTDQDAANLAERLLFKTVTENAEQDIIVSSEYTYLSANDYVTIDDQTFVVTQAFIQDNREVQLTLRRVIAVSNDNVNAVVSTPTPPDVGVTSQVAYTTVIIDTPLIDPTITGELVGDLSYFYVGVLKQNNNTFTPVTIGVNNGLYVSVAKAIQYGTTETSLIKNKMNFGIDRESVLTVTYVTTPDVSEYVVFNDDVEFAESNLNILRVDQELIKFRNWQVTGNVVEYWNLIRGHNATDQFAVDHGLGERVLLYTPDSWALVALPNANPIIQSVTAAANGGPPTSLGVKHYGARTYPLVPIIIDRESDGGIVIKSAFRDVLEYSDGLSDTTVSRSTVSIYFTTQPFEWEQFFESIDVDPSDAPYIKRRAENLAASAGGDISFTYGVAAQAADGFNPLTDPLYVVIIRISRKFTEYSLPVYRTIFPQEYR